MLFIFLVMVRVCVMCRDIFSIFCFYPQCACCWADGKLWIWICGKDFYSK